MAVDPEIPSLISSLNDLLAISDGQDFARREPEIRLTLEKVRSYLLSQSESLSPEQENITSDVTNSIVRAITHQVNRVFRDWLGTLQQQAEQLESQRRELLRDVEQLSLLEGVMERLHEQFQGLQQQKFYASQSLQFFQEYQQQSEQTLTHLENSFKATFLDLEKDLETYCQSLGKSLEQMSNLGQQGEAKLMEYLGNLHLDLPELPQIRAGIYERLPEITWYLALEVEQEYWRGILVKKQDDSWQEIPLVWCEGEKISGSYPRGNQQSWARQLQQAWQEVVTTEELSQESLTEARRQLRGIFVNLSSESEAIAEGLLQADFVLTREQIGFQEPALAVWLGTEEEEKDLNSPWVIVLYGGTTSRQIALISPQADLSEAMVVQTDYGVKQLEQDLLCQLLYPQWVEEFADSLPAIAPSIPEPGAAQVKERETLLEILTNHNLGLSLLEVAHLSRLILERQTSFASHLKGQTWQIQQKQLTIKVIEPLLNQLEEELDNLLRQKQLGSEAIGRVIIAGQLWTNLPPVAKWLEEKFPHARLIAKGATEKNSPLALGLARAARLEASVPK